MKVVNGRLFNIQTKNDTTLITFQTIYGEKAVGRNIIYETDRYNY